MKAGADSRTILQALTSVLAGQDLPAALHEPHFEGNEWRYVKECLDTGWVSSAGKYVERFEEMLAEYTGVRRAVAVVNGTAALHICLLLAGVKQYDEVLIPTLSFIATANAVSYCGALPHFVESCEENLGLDPAKLETYLAGIAEIRGDGSYNRFTGRRIAALVPMHTFGHPVDLEPLAETCRRYRLELIEDAAESLGSLYRGRHTGSFGRASALSFNGNKVVTTGGGGAILTNDLELARAAKHLTSTAKLPHKWEFFHDLVGYNYRMPNLNAALGCAQLEQLPGFIESKRALARSYREAFEGVAGVRFFSEAPYARSNYWLNAIILDESQAALRDGILESTNSQGIMTRPAWIPLHRLPIYSDCPRMELPVAESLGRRIINIPSSSSLGKGGAA
jgi:perosamine synthetase